jgi:hypothetical protein
MIAQTVVAAAWMDTRHGESWQAGIRASKVATPVRFRVAVREVRRIGREREPLQPVSSPARNLLNLAQQRDHLQRRFLA